MTSATICRRVVRRSLLAGAAVTVLTSGSAWAQSTPSNEAQTQPSASTSSDMASTGGQSTSANAGAAATTSDDRQYLDDIIVTATKRAEPVQKVPQTVNVVTGATIKELHVQNTIELTQIVGGLNLSMTSPSEQSISLRGIKEPSGGGPSAYTVETYLNQVPISVIDAFAATLDIGQIEVLKGPQGTLQGRPAPSGALTIATEKGSFTKTDGYVAGTLSNRRGRRLEGAAGGPLSPTLSFRVAGLYDFNGGNQVTDIATGKRDYTETGVLRGTLSWKPSDRFSADLMYQHTTQNGDFYRQITGTKPCNAPPIPLNSLGCGQTFDLKDRIALNAGGNPNRYIGNLATLNIRFGLSDRVGVYYVGGYNKTSYFTRLDFDFAGLGAGVGGPAYLTVNNNGRAISNELRLQSEGEGFYNFTYGVFLRNQSTTGLFNFPPFVANSPNSTSVNDLGLFTNQRFQFTQKDNFQIGVRYSKVSTEDRLTSLRRHYDAFTGNASYQHQFTSTVMAYASIGTSFRPGSGGTNQSPVQGVIPASFGNFEDEKSRSIEIGLKTQFFDRRLTANIAIFDQKFNGYITSQFNVACTGVPNPNGLSFATRDGTAGGVGCFGTMTGNGNAISRGVELELHARPTNSWNVNGIFTYTDAHFANALLPCNDYNGDGITDSTGVPKVQKGQYVSVCNENGPLGSLPKVSVSFNTSYDMNLGDVPAYIRLNTFTRSSSYFPQTGRTFKGYTTVGGSIGVFSPDRAWEFNVFVKNLFNTVEEDTDGGNWTVFGSVPSGLRIGTVTARREIGATLRRTF